MSTIDTDRPTGTEIVTTQRPKSVLIDMADRYGMEPLPFEATVRAIAMPANATREEFAAFLLVAKEYHLNPLTKEIYAFPKRGGGIVPIVSIDGWVSLVNSHPACDGFSFSWEQDDKGQPLSCTCTMYRKDRTHPVVVTEYLAECIRPTDPWKMKHRMLRHKALIQGARYAFGFSGIYDADEGEVIAAARDITPTPARRAVEQFPDPDEETPAKPAEATTEQAEPKADAFDADAFLVEIEETLAKADTEEAIEEAWDALDAPPRLSGEDERYMNEAFALKEKHLVRVGVVTKKALEAQGQATMFPGDDDSFPGDR